MLHYISPTGAGSRDGSTWANAASIGQIGQVVRDAGTGDTIMLRADAGAYTIGSTPLSLQAGGASGAPITIRGVDGAGNAMNALFVSDRAAIYSSTAKQGGEVFRLLDGADHLVFVNMAFKDVSNAFRIGADVADVTIRNMTATNVSRFLDDVVSSSALSSTATVSGLVVRDVTVMGFAKGVINIRYDSHDVLIDKVVGDSRHIDGANFAIGIHIDGTAITSRYPIP